MTPTSINVTVTITDETSDEDVASLHDLGFYDPMKCARIIASAIERSPPRSSSRGPSASGRNVFLYLRDAESGQVAGSFLHCSLWDAPALARQIAVEIASSSGRTISVSRVVAVVGGPQDPPQVDGCGLIYTVDATGDIRPEEPPA